MQNQTKKPLNYLNTLGLVSIALTVFASTAGAVPGQTIVNTVDQGIVQGVETEYGQKFLGIPYAAAPVGDLRWKAPQPHAGWDGFLDASEFAPHCPQVPSPFGEPSVDEDCLYLNIYSSLPAVSSGKDPVMVWFHGGAFIYGQSDGYDPAKLVEQGIVVVTVNYRIGALGFMAHPALTAESGASGNYGLMDQQAALRWVRDNIKRFKGDPDNVTIFGNSAGGHSVHAHLVSPGSGGLFHRAIVQSGAYLLEQPAMADWEYLGLSIAAAAGCPTQDTACMRALSVEDILANQDPGPSGWLPVVDGQFLPMTVAAAFYSGMFNRVPVMEGTTHDEYALFTALYFDLAGNFITDLNSYIQAIVNAFGIPVDLAVYLATVIYPISAYASAAEAFVAIGTDIVFACNALGATSMLSQFVPVYTYEFNDPNAPQIFLPPVSFPYKAYHVSEVQYLFNIRNSSQLFTPEQADLSDIMVRYWTQFATAGDPNVLGNPAWPGFNPMTFNTLSLEAPTPQIINDFALDHKCDFWASL
ncbi:MAG: carboxylesterase family protein [Deltaproteobacteria bacterium]|nr:carboxylesterase family protein [Deltaproteobacteria bacterium]